MPRPHVDTSELLQAGKQLEQLGVVTLTEELEKGLYIAGVEVRREARALVPVDTAALKLSIRADLIRGQTTSVEVGPTKPYGYNVEYGRKPGSPVPIKAIERWAQKRGLNPYAVAKSIQKKGIAAKPFMEPALEKVLGVFDRIMLQAIENAMKIALRL